MPSFDFDDGPPEFPGLPPEMQQRSPADPAESDPEDDRRSQTARVLEVRGRTMKLCEPLEAEDYVAQSMTEASPVKWHIAHTTWFFEQFVLTPFDRTYTPFHPGYAYLFNSYYNAVGQRVARSSRGMLTRPTLREVRLYRTQVNDALVGLLQSAGEEERARIWPVVELGLHHEQQHQELLLTDLKHLLSLNPLQPVYRAVEPLVFGEAQTEEAAWIPFPEGVREIGFPGGGFAFDNEMPRHKVFLHSYALADRLATNREYLLFMGDGGYERPELWLDDGWSAVRARGWRAPLYWSRVEGEWVSFTLAGARPIDPDEPVCHISFYEADAFARWAGARLPSEAEWEAACVILPMRGNLAEQDRFHPAACSPEADEQPILRQAFGDVWEWTAGAYAPYPGYRPTAGALGEYNGKFMCNQYVLRGGSCATPASHIRPTYRNFFYPDARWQFAGVRLARDLR